jgi:hypothetical protein
MKNTLIQIFGDPTIEWQIVKPGLNTGSFVGMEKKFSSVLHSQTSGAALTTEFLKSLLKESNVEISGVSIKYDMQESYLKNEIATSWSTWQAYSDKISRNPPAYRICERIADKPGTWSQPMENIEKTPDLLIIEDKGMGFRDSPKFWPHCLTDTKFTELPKQLIIDVVLDGKDGQPEILKQVFERGLGDRTAVITSVAELRNTGAQISAPISWERTFEDIILAVRGSRSPFTISGTRDLAFSKVIIMVGLDGAVIVSRESNILIFNKTGLEGDLQSKFPGEMPNLSSCILAGLSATWALNGNETNWIESVKRGLFLARDLHTGGYTFGNDGNLEFPLRRLKELFNTDLKRPILAGSFGVFDDNGAPVVLGEEDRGSWTILNKAIENRIGNQESSETTHWTNLVTLSKEIARGEKTALSDIPEFKLGFLGSWDRREIESLYNIRTRIREYLKDESKQVPLALGVFAPAGRGVMFTLNQIGHELGINKLVDFDLSLFSGPDDLTEAMFTVRDKGLKDGQVPMVLWNGFDSPCMGQNFGWLRHFIGALSTGEVFNGAKSNPLGKCIYIFTSKSAWSFQEFASACELADKSVYASDFTAYLSAFIDINGINPQPMESQLPLYPLRRAFFLNFHVRFRFPGVPKTGKIEIPDEMLNAFLFTASYRQGTRSLSALIENCAVNQNKRFDLSSLPPEHVLALHVDVKDFMNLTRSNPVEVLMAREAKIASPVLTQEGKVFISVKSEDFPYAQQVYDFLSGQGIDVFFCRESLQTLGRSDYRHEIDQALEETDHMVVVTSRPENVRSEWVEAEWGIFINEKRSGRKKGNLVTMTAGTMQPSDLPPSLRYYEVIPFNDSGMQLLLKYMTK